MHQKRHKYLLAVFTLFTCINVLVAEEANSNVASTFTEKKMRISASLAYVNMKIKDVDLSSLSINANLGYGLTSTMAAGVQFRQGMALSGFSPTFFAIDLFYRIALMGHTILKTENISIAGKSTYLARDKNTGGLYWDLYLHQYFVTTSIASIPFPGIGTGLEYEFSLSEPTCLGVGLRVDHATNAKDSFMPIQLFVGLKLWL